MQRRGISFLFRNGLSEGRGSDYTLGMDSVRFGRALGIGTRLAAKTLVEAVDAAMAPNPAAKAGTPGATPTRAEAAGTQAAQQVRQTASQVKRTGAGAEGGWQAVRRGGGGAAGEARGSAVAGADRGVLWDLRSVRRDGDVEAAGEPAFGVDES